MTNLKPKQHQPAAVAVKFYGPKADTEERQNAPLAQRKLQAQRVGPPFYGPGRFGVRYPWSDLPDIYGTAGATPTL